MLDGEKIEFVHGNYPKADSRTYQTAQPDIFVGGDVYTGPKFVIDAIAAARFAAESIHRYVRPNCNMTVGREINMLDKDTAVIPIGYDKTPRQEPGMEEPKAKKLGFTDLRKPLTEEQVKKETARCLSCGCTIVDPNRCIGCGICTTKCKFDAIKLSRDIPEAANMILYEDALKVMLPFQAKRMKNIAIRTIKEKREKK